MKKKLILVLAVCLAGFAGYSQSMYDFPIDKHDFGVIEEGDIASYEFEFINGGKDSLSLKRENIRPSCGCTTPKVTEGSIAPGARGKITAEYNTMGRVGAFNKTINIFDSTSIIKVLTIKGVVIKKEEKPVLSEADIKKGSKFSIDKKENNFGKIEKGQMVAYRFTVKNTGKDSLKITSGQSACGCINYKLFVKENSSTTYVLPGKSATLEITYSPQGIGKNRDIITLFTNDPGNPWIGLVLTADVVESLIEKSPVKQEDSGSPFMK